MCGIAGLAGRVPVTPRDHVLVDAMLRTLAHRGPDDQFSLASTNAIVGARRLSIIDLTTGRQPLANEDGAVIASNNGEIYNYVELRDELRSAGHVLRTEGDTEVIAHLFEDLGPAFVQRLRGMFAIAIWDERARRLILTRDRVGKKPVYWTIHQGQLRYGSELKALLADPAIERRVDTQALALYLRYQYVPSPHTIYEGIHKLEPGHVLEWDGSTVRVERYWSPRWDQKTALDLEERRSALRELLTESVRLRLRSDVPVGVFLSGGMDSGAIAAIAAQMSPKIRTFSIGFDDRDFDELPYARQLARALGTEHVEDVVTLDAIELLPELADHYDEPFGDSSAVPTFRVAQLAARDVRVVLTGDGGDESFGGYRRYAAMRTLDRLRLIPAAARRALKAGSTAVAGTGIAGPRTQARLRRGWEVVGLPFEGRYLELMSIFSEEDIRRLMSDRVAGPTSEFLGARMDGSLDPVDRMLAADVLTYLPEDLLVKMDRATMANSLEARAPLLDHKLMEFAASLPASDKIRGRQSKAILRDVIEDLLPKGYLDRPKMGFGVPIDAWFRGRLGPVLEDALRQANSPLDGLVDRSVALQFLRAHRAGENHGPRLWSLLMLSAWADHWVRSTRAVAA